MKKVLVVFSIAFFLVGSVPRTVTGQTKTATGSSKAASDEAGIDSDTKKFKEKIVNAVSEQYKKDRKAVSGFVTKTSDSLLTIKTDTDEDLEVKNDEILTKIYQISNGQKKEIKMSQIEKGDYIIATGPMIDKTVTANFIYMDEKYLVKTGKITEVNKEEYSLKVSTVEKDVFTIDIETSTKQQILNINSLVLEKVGFSKIKEGDTIHFTAIKTGKEKEPNHFPAQKIVIIPQEYFLK
ncbi:hypothetical protein GYA28_04230 [Candidatus Roizmanbacteria bacterium]|jgi:hypothetical protein|nr:hypothetical protein [Candidatus Roizmanbacteria bacterium]